MYQSILKFPRGDRKRQGPQARLLNLFWRLGTTNEKADNVFRYLHHSRDTRSARCSAQFDRATGHCHPDAACTDEAKEALYSAFLKNRADDQAKAYEDAKKYLACPAGQVTEAQQKIIDYLKKWVAKYEEITRASRFQDLLYNQMKDSEAYALGKEILTAQPENLQGDG